MKTLLCWKKRTLFGFLIVAWPLAAYGADLNNVSDGPFAGAVTAALYLRQFVTETGSWAHVGAPPNANINQNIDSPDDN